LRWYGWLSWVGYGGANNDDAAMISFLTSQNIIGSGGVIVTNNAVTAGWNRDLR